MLNLCKKWKVLLVLVVLVTAGGWILGNRLGEILRGAKLHASSGVPGNLMELLVLSPEELGKVDVARMNLLCAEGLPGAEGLEIEACLKILDDWAGKIKKDTELRLGSYYQNPVRYDNSVNLFKAVNMVLTLKEAMGVDYNLEIMKSNSFKDARNFFIHGCLEGKKQGGCISMPVLSTAVGRRLGYPLKLATTREHVFFRWEKCLFGKGV